MRENDKIYGWTISFYEWEPTIPTLWETTKGEYLFDSAETLVLLLALRFSHIRESSTIVLVHGLRTLFYIPIRSL